MLTHTLGIYVFKVLLLYPNNLLSFFPLQLPSSFFPKEGLSIQCLEVDLLSWEFNAKGGQVGKACKTEETGCT